MSGFTFKSSYMKNVYFNKKLSFCIIFVSVQTNVFIEMVIHVAVDCKSDSREVFIDYQGTETAIAHKN